MAMPACHLRMFAFQHIASLPVVKIALAIFPNDQIKIPAVVLAVTRGARLRFFY